MMAFALLTDVLDWRASNRPWDARCPVCAGQERGHSQRQVGWDVERHPVWYSSLAQCLDRYDSSANMLHLQGVMETWARLERIGRAPADGKWVYVLDFEGFGARDALHASTGLKSCLIVRKYPERLSRLFLVDAPSIFSGPLSQSKVAHRNILSVSKGNIERAHARQPPRDPSSTNYRRRLRC